MVGRHRGVKQRRFVFRGMQGVMLHYRLKLAVCEDAVLQALAAGEIEHTALMPAIHAHHGGSQLVVHFFRIVGPLGIEDF